MLTPEEKAVVYAARFSGKDVYEKALICLGQSVSSVLYHNDTQDMKGVGCMQIKKRIANMMDDKASTSDMELMVLAYSKGTPSYYPAPGPKADCPPPHADCDVDYDYDAYYDVDYDVDCDVDYDANDDADCSALERDHDDTWWAGYKVPGADCGTPDCDAPDVDCYAPDAECDAPDADCDAPDCDTCDTPDADCNNDN